MSRLSAERTDCDKLFHAFVPAIENAVSEFGSSAWNVVISTGLLVAERCRRRPGSSLTSDRVLLM